MGRAKQRMELIGSRTSRCTTFRKRLNGMKKKASELGTLCDVEVCAIVYGPTKDEQRPPYPSKAETWPEKSDTLIHRLIDSHKNQPAEDRVKRTQTLSNFFIDRNQKIEDSLVKLRKKNDEATYSTWDDGYLSWSVEELRGFEVVLEGKVQDVKARIAFMMGSSDHTRGIFENPPWFEQGMFGMRNMVHEQQQQQQPISIEVPNLLYPFSDHQIQQGIHEIDSRLMANDQSMMMPNYNYGDHYGGIQLGGEFVCNINQLETRPADYGYAPSLMPAGTLEDHMMYNNCPLPVGYFNPNMETVLSPYLGCFNTAASDLPHMDNNLATHHDQNHDQDYDCERGRWGLRVMQEVGPTWM